MAMPLGEAFVEVKADLQQLSEGLSEARESVSSAVSDMGDNMIAFGEGVEKTGKTLSKFVTGTIVGLTASMAGLVGTFANYADEVMDLSAETGASTEAIQQWQGVAENAGTSANAVADALSYMNRSGFEQISKGSEATTEALNKTGISMTELENATPDEKMEMLVDGLASVENESERAELGAELLGRQWSNMAPIVDDVADSQNGLSGEMEKINTLSEDQLIELDGARREWVSLKREFLDVIKVLAVKLVPIFTETLLPMLRDQLIPIVLDVADRIGTFVNMFNELDAETRRNIVTIIALVASLGPVLIAIGKVIQIGGTLIKAFVAINIPMLLIIGTIVALIAIFTHLWKENEAFRDFVIEVWNNIKESGLEVFGLLKEFFVETFDIILETVMSILDDVLAFWEEHGEAIVENAEEFLTSVSEFITGILSGIFDLITSILSSIQEFWEDHGEQIMFLVMFAFNYISDLISETMDLIVIILDTAFGLIETIFDLALNILSGLIDWFVALFKGDFEGMSEAGQDIMQAMWDAIKGIVETVWNKLLKPVFGDLWADLSSWFRDLIDDGREWFSTLFTRIATVVRTSWIRFIRDPFNNLLTRISNWFNNTLIGRAIGWGKDLISNFIKGLRDAPMQGISNVVGRIGSFFGGSEPSEGALKDITNFGSKIMENFVDGMEMSTGKMARKMEAMSFELERGLVGIDYGDMGDPSRSDNFMDGSRVGNITLNQQMQTGMTAEDIQRNIERALRKMAVEFKTME